MPDRSAREVPSPTPQPSPARAHARALADPTRYSVFEHIRRAADPVTVADLAARFGLHPNAIRFHLGRLRDAGLITEAPLARSGPGRPPLGYRLSPGAVESWAPHGPHEQMSLMLLELVTSGRGAREVGRDAGIRLAAEAGGRDGVERVIGVTRRLGFDPGEVRALEPADAADEDGAGGLLEVVLRHCPFAVGVERAPQVVCALHRGIAEGVAAADGGVEVVDLVVRDPHDTCCSLRFSPHGPQERPDGRGGVCAAGPGPG